MQPNRDQPSTRAPTRAHLTRPPEQARDEHGKHGCYENIPEKHGRQPCPALFRRRSAARRALQHGPSDGSANVNITRKHTASGGSCAGGEGGGPRPITATPEVLGQGADDEPSKLQPHGTVHEQPGCQKQGHPAGPRTGRKRCACTAWPPRTSTAAREAARSPGPGAAAPHGRPVLARPAWPPRHTQNPRRDRIPQANVTQSPMPES